MVKQGVQEMCPVHNAWCDYTSAENKIRIIHAANLDDSRSHLIAHF